jgi:hypothetical protein
MDEDVLMSQRSFFLVAVLLLLLVSGLAAVLVVLVRQEPAWYTSVDVPHGSDRMEQFSQVLQAWNDLKFGIDNKREWDGRFTDHQINSYLEEAYSGSGRDHDLLPDDISQPRIAFEPDHVRLAFRYGHGIWSSVVSIDLRAWLPASEPNVVALELEGFHAGALPISAQSLLEKIAEFGRKSGMEVSWYRTKGHPVALVRFQPDQPRPTFQMQALYLQEHALTIQGRSIDQTPGQPAEPAKTTDAAP